jgi:hypothetical protein
LLVRFQSDDALKTGARPVSASVLAKAVDQTALWLDDLPFFSSWVCQSGSAAFVRVGLTALGFAFGELLGKVESRTIPK